MANPDSGKMFPKVDWMFPKVDWMFPKVDRMFPKVDWMFRKMYSFKMFNGKMSGWKPILLYRHEHIHYYYCILVHLAPFRKTLIFCWRVAVLLYYVIWYLHVIGYFLFNAESLFVLDSKKCPISTLGNIQLTLKNFHQTLGNIQSTLGNIQQPRWAFSQL
jgi:hypothetical protein